MGQGVARWDGSAWAAMSTGIEGGQGFGFASFAPSGAEELHVVGRFSVAGGSLAGRIARWADGQYFWDGASWLPRFTTIDEVTSAIQDAVVVNGPDASSLFVGGLFAFADGVSSSYIGEHICRRSLIFFDGFESGNTAAWSRTQPPSFD